MPLQDLAVVGVLALLKKIPGFGGLGKLSQCPQAVSFCVVIRVHLINLLFSGSSHFGHGGNAILNLFHL